MFNNVSCGSKLENLAFAYGKASNRVGVEPLQFAGENSLTGDFARRRGIFQNGAAPCGGSSSATCLSSDNVAEVYRVINSDSDGLSRLAVDRYINVLFCGIYSLGVFKGLAPATRVAWNEVYARAC